MLWSQYFGFFCYKQIRPIDKKLQYQIQKLTRVSGSTTQQQGTSNEASDGHEKTQDPLTYRPNPDMLISKADMMPDVSFAKYYLLSYFGFVLLFVY